MKKGRLGTRLTVLTSEDQSDAVLRVMFEQTSTFGVRVETVDRATLAREIVTVSTAFGPIRVKLGRLGDRVVRWSAEHRDCEDAARRHAVSPDMVHHAAVEAARRGE